MAPVLDIPILAQPDDVTCGPTCLQALYAYWGDEVAVDTVIRDVVQLETRGTLAVHLGNHALRRGYRATIYTYNLEVFDPSWFVPGVDLSERLRAQADVKPAPRLQAASRAYLEFLSLGGTVRYEDLRPRLLRGILTRGAPILTGLSATHLYGSPREVDEDGRLRYDDVHGQPTGHFVVLCGWDHRGPSIRVADPLLETPSYHGHRYSAPAHRVLSAILLGALTYDANLLVVEP